MKTLNLNFPTREELLPIIAEYIIDGELRHFDSTPYQIDVAGSIIVKDFHKTGQIINLHQLQKELSRIAQSYEMFRYFKACIKTYKDNWCHIPEAELEENSAYFGTAKLEEDFIIKDNDPYETPGGYREWIVPKGSICTLGLDKNLSIKITMKASCLVDHYNNNFAGLSTGNGTTTYKLGDREELRSVTVGREGIDSKWTSSRVKLTDHRINREKLANDISLMIPEFDELM